jgi:hypothetical protein
MVVGLTLGKQERLENYLLSLNCFNSERGFQLLCFSTRGASAADAIIDDVKLLALNKMPHCTKKNLANLLPSPF